MRISKKQQAMFWAIWKKAEGEELPASASRDERTLLRRKVIFEACAKKSLKTVNPTRDYDNLMYIVASLACDYESMLYWSIAAERRTVHMIAECARQIGEIVGEPKGWEYCRSIFIQANLPADWMDIPEGLLMSTFKMLDTHRRRLLRRDFDWSGARLGQPLGFSPRRHYIRCGNSVDYSDQPLTSEPDS